MKIVIVGWMSIHAIRRSGEAAAPQPKCVTMFAAESRIRSGITAQQLQSRSVCEVTDSP
jgi:hypothetical protein